MDDAEPRRRPSVQRLLRLLPDRQETPVVAREAQILYLRTDDWVRRSRRNRAFLYEQEPTWNAELI